MAADHDAIRGKRAGLKRDSSVLDRRFVPFFSKKKRIDRIASQQHEFFCLVLDLTNRIEVKEQFF